MAMHGLDLTYATLATTRNEAAIDALADGLDSGDRIIRRRCLEALMTRSEPRCAEAILQRWHHLQAEDVRALLPGKRTLASAIGRALGEDAASAQKSSSPADRRATAIAATVQLELNELIPPLVQLAESCPVDQLRRQATDAVLQLAQSLGRDARRNYDRPSERGPALARLAKSVPMFPTHQNEDLLDAFLAISSWSDRDLRNLLDSTSPHADRLIQRFAASRQPAVIDLAAGFLRRRTVPEPLKQVLHGRHDALFRERLLRTIGSSPSAAMLRNLAALGIPHCCRDGEELLDDLAPNDHAALAQLYVAADTDNIRTLHILAAVVQRGGPGTEAAAARGFRQCEVPSSDVWIRAAIPIAQGDYATIERDYTTRLLYRLIRLLDHGNANLVEAVRRVLAPLHMKPMLSQFESLDTKTRWRLGHVVRMIDPQSIECIEQALRHPLLQRRLQAITAATAVAGAEELVDSFAHVIHEDHREARLRAVEALRHASSERTLTLLREMTTLPESGVRDAAKEALHHRLRQMPQNGDSAPPGAVPSDSARPAALPPADPEPTDDSRPAMDAP